jgi:O-antigen/teichoic acid export membrane protein
LKVKLLKYLNEGHERSVRTKWNVIYSMLFRIGSVLCNLLMVPILLDYLNPTKFGIWLTLSSIVTWMAFLDIGLGNGLRNKLAEALAKQDFTLARSYVSTTYAAISGIVLIIVCVFLIVNPLLSWSGILNTPPDMEHELSILVVFMFVFFSMRFVSSLITPILAGYQFMGLNSIIDFAMSFISLIAVFCIAQLYDDSLLTLGAVLSFINFFVPLVASVWFFKKRFKTIIPSYSHINAAHLKELSAIGLQFFFIQIAAVVIFSTSNIIIIQVLNAEEVTKFNIVYKYFSVITLGFSMIINPFWSAYTEAYVKNDIDWIKRITGKLIQFWILLTAGVVVMVAVSDFVYYTWTGKDLDIPVSLSVFMGVFVIIGTWNNIYVYFINGIAKIRLQLYLAVGVALLNIPLTIYLVKHLGTEGAVVSSIICLVPAAVMMPLQYKLIIRNRAFGIFNA